MVIKGKAELSLEDIRDKEKELIVINGDSPEIVGISPMIAHSIKNIGKTEMFLTAFVSEPFDKNDPDTYFYRVI